jgi:hypothetical protein
MQATRWFRQTSNTGTFHNNDESIRRLHSTVRHQGSRWQSNCLLPIMEIRYTVELDRRSVAACCGWLVEACWFAAVEEAVPALPATTGKQVVFELSRRERPVVRLQRAKTSTPVVVVGIVAIPVCSSGRCSSSSSRWRRAALFVAD